MVYCINGKTREPGGLPSFLGGVLSPGGGLFSNDRSEAQTYPPLRRKEGDANVCYILGFDSVWNIHLHPCRIVLRDFQGNTKIAAITCNNDGC